MTKKFTNLGTQVAARVPKGRKKVTLRALLLKVGKSATRNQLDSIADELRKRGFNVRRKKGHKYFYYIRR